MHTSISEQDLFKGSVSHIVGVNNSSVGAALLTYSGTQVTFKTAPPPSKRISFHFGCSYFYR